MTSVDIALLKSQLPDIPVCCPDLMKESSNSLCGPCPVCGGKDRFIYKTDSKKGFCRQCHPSVMDIIDFHCWLYGKEISDLSKEYLHSRSIEPWQTRTPWEMSNSSQNSPVQKKQDPTIQNQWDSIIDLNESMKPTVIYEFLHGNRKIANEIITKLIDSKLVQVKTHAGKRSVAVPFKTLQGEVRAIQFLSADGEPFPFTEKNGSPANKVFLKGSQPGDECFFICGADLATFNGQARGSIIICEAVINTITAFEWFPDACCIALGGSTYTAKIKALKPYLPNVEKVIVCVDNDDASEKMLRAIWEIL